MSDIKITYHFDEKANKDIIQTTQDCEPIMDEVKAVKEISDGRGGTCMGYHAGRIPAEVVNGYLKRVGITFHEFVNDSTHIHRILNDPDYRVFRVWEGRV